MSSISLSLNPLIPLRVPPEIRAKSFPFATLHPRKQKLPVVVYCAGLDNSSQNTSASQQLNLSVLRFTFGIPGFDESYLPRWIGYAFGSLLLLNHFVGSHSSTITPAQLRTEILGLSLAAFSVLVPYLGKFLKGATPINGKTIPEGAEQIFFMSQNISDNLKENLAWGTYVLLRNTNTISVLISLQDALCVRGYWNAPRGGLEEIRNWFKEQIQEIGLSNVKETLFFPQAGDSKMWEILPKGTQSILVQPVLQGQDLNSSETEKSDDFVLLASSSSYAYSNKDRAWIGAVANKFRGNKT